VKSKDLTWIGRITHGCQRYIYCTLITEQINSTVTVIPTASVVQLFERANLQFVSQSNLSNTIYRANEGWLQYNDARFPEEKQL